MHAAVEAIQLPHQIQLLALLAPAQEFRRRDVRHGRFPKLDVRHRGLVDSREESGIVKRAPAGRKAVLHHHESRHVPVLRPQPVGHPRTEAGVALYGIARVHKDLSGGVNRRIGVHRVDERDVVDHFRQVREDLADPRAALAIALEREHRRNDARVGVVLLRVQAFQVFLGEDFPCQFSSVLLQKRLVIERLKLAGPADHEEEDDVLRLGGEVWLLGSEWLAEVARRYGRRAAHRLVSKQAGQSESAQAEFLEGPAAVPTDGSSSNSLCQSTSMNLLRLVKVWRYCTGERRRLSPEGNAPLLRGRTHLPTQGSMKSIPVPSKSRTFLVATAAPREWAMAAIWQSACAIGRPALRRCAATSA